MIKILKFNYNINVLAGLVTNYSQYCTQCRHLLQHTVSMILVSIVLTAIYCSSVWPVIFWNSSLIWTMSISHRDTTTLTSVSSSVPIPFIVFWSWYAKWAALFLTHRTWNINENWLDRQNKKISESFSLVEETCSLLFWSLKPLSLPMIWIIGFSKFYIIGWTVEHHILNEVPLWKYKPLFYR